MFKKLQQFVLITITLAIISLTAKGQSVKAYLNPALPMDERVNNLLSQLTLQEKIGLLGYQNQAVPRLGIPAYNWWNEALHGVARAGSA